MIGLPPGHCPFCGQEHASRDAQCPPLPTRGENLVVEYRRAKARILATGGAPLLTAREAAGACLTVGGRDGARAVAQGYRSAKDQSYFREIRRLVNEAVEETPK
jgi:hypothetical protein